ncbi:MAG: NADH:ubiquinone oxidoreductase, partial [Candidatus Delongbacteria bacterium]|nr:NADH:ubiquinone oxidoreductase [Candidatus Delongbacteria bacterium]
RDFLDRYPIDLFIPGCPVHPLTCVNGILSFLQR